MKTKMTESGLPYKVIPTGMNNAKFHDGMIVSAEDLETASQYPVSLLQSVLRSYLGCGVVCGLGLSSATSPTGDRQWVVRVERGLAVDCHGFPIELTCPVDLDFNPDPCTPDKDRPTRFFVALRRITSPEGVSDPCGCAETQTDEDCNRVRDRVLVKAFTGEQLRLQPDLACGYREDLNRKPPAGDNEPKNGGDSSGTPTAPSTAVAKSNTTDTDWCTALRACSCSCNSDWVLLGTVDVKIDATGQHLGIEKANSEDRQWVKPTSAYSSLVKQVEELREQLAALTPPSPRVND